MENLMKMIKGQNVKELLDLFEHLEEIIHQYFGYREDWVKIPLADYTGYFWKAIGDDKVCFGSKYDSVIKGMQGEYDNFYYEDSIYTQRFLPKWVYRGEDYTMISIDTNVDGNKFLAIFLNSKEVK